MADEVEKVLRGLALLGFVAALLLALALPVMVAWEIGVVTFHHWRVAVPLELALVTLAHFLGSAWDAA